MKKLRVLMEKPCTECGGNLEKKTISQEFEREGIKIKLSGLKAWVCMKCDEIYFQPGSADKIAGAANCLFELAVTEEQHKGTLNIKMDQKELSAKP